MSFPRMELLAQVRMGQEGGHYLGTKGCILRERNDICEPQWCFIQSKTYPLSVAASECKLWSLSGLRTYMKEVFIVL